MCFETGISLHFISGRTEFPILALILLGDIAARSNSTRILILKLILKYF